MYTFLFTDVEGSTKLWEQHATAMSLALTQHDSILNNTIKRHQGRVFKTVGDAFYAVFDAAENALKAAADIQLELHTAKLPIELGVRMAIHTGEAERRRDDYFGPTLNRVARLESAAHGGQILISESTLNEVDLPESYALRDLGVHRLRSLSEPIHIYQLMVAGLPVVSTPIRSLTPHPTNLPASLTSFVGRENEIQAVSAMLRQKPLRLLTMTGTGGIGKTRLSCQVGHSLLDDFHDGVFFVDLSILKFPDDLLSSIAEALNIHEEENLAAEVKAYLRARRILLILDNFEQILDAALTVNELLAAAPGLSVMVTSRETLNLYGEHVYHVRPLAVPEVGSFTSAANVRDFPAVALFMERVQIIHPDFMLTDANAGEISAICGYLEGLPLAIELAAVHVGDDMSLSDFRIQLKSRLEVLKSTYRGLSPRQRTMRGAIQWSYDLLTKEEQRVFISLGVFVGAFSQAAAQAVSGTSGFSALINKNLLQPLDGDNLSMLAVLREFALEQQIEQQQYDLYHQRCADFYLEHIEASEPHLTGEQQAEWFNQLRFAYPNIRSTLTWLMTAEQVEKAARMTAVLWRYWAVQSKLTEGLGWLDAILAKPHRLPSALRAKILHGAGRLAMFRSEYARAKTLLETGLEVFRADGDRSGQAMTLSSMGENELQSGNLIQGEQHFGESLTLYKESGGLLEMARPLDNLGNIALYLGNLETAAYFLEESLALERRRGSIEGMARILNNLAEMKRVQQKYDEAKTYYQESLAIYSKLGLSVGIAVVLHNLGQIALIQEQYARAAELFRDALRLHRDMEEQRLVAECLTGLGCALLYTQDKNPVRAVRLFSAAEGLLTELRTQLAPVDEATYQHHKAVAAERLDAAAWKAAWTEGATMPLARILESSLK